jgi:hypothetical protein
MVAGDVVQFFCDGVSLRFPPNAEMNEPVTYLVGPSQQYPTIDAAMAALKRKTIGATGFVTLQMIAGEFDGPIVVSHPSGDRIAVVGTMISTNPTRADFLANGNSAPQRDSDAASNRIMLRQRFGTIITLPDDQIGRVGTGLRNAGPGAVRFRNLLIEGQRIPTINGFWWQVGVGCDPGFNCACENIAVWGAQVGFVDAGSMNCFNCFAVGGSYIGWYVASGYLTTQRCCALGNAAQGLFINFGNVVGTDCNIEMNAATGCYSNNSSGVQMWWTSALGNVSFNYQANVTSSIVIVTLPDGSGSNYLPVDPPLNTIGNLGSVVTLASSARPPTNPLLSASADDEPMLITLLPAPLPTLGP